MEQNPKQQYLITIATTTIGREQTQSKVKKTNLNCSVERATCEGVVVLGIDNNLHDVMRVTLKHLRARPFFLPVPQFDEHVIWQVGNDPL